MGTIEEKLNELLDQKNDEIEKLLNKIEDMEERLAMNWEWTAHKYCKKDEYNLPVPRLQLVAFRHKRYGWNRTTWKYSLVYQLLSGNIGYIPLGQTEIGGRLAGTRPDAKLNLPLREGVDIRYDCLNLRLPAFSIVEDQIVQLEPYNQEPNEK